MKHVQVFGASERHNNALGILQDLGAMEVHRLRPPKRTGASRRALLRLLNQVRRVAEREYPPHQPESIPGDLIVFCRSLLKEIDRLEHEAARLRMALDRQRVWGDTSPDALAALSENDVHVQCWITRDKNLLDSLAERGIRAYVLEQKSRSELVFCTVNSGKPVDLDHARNIAPPVTVRADLQHELEETEARITAVGSAVCWIHRQRRRQLVQQVADAHDALELKEVRSEILLDPHVFLLSGWVPEDRIDELDQSIGGLPGVTARYRDPLPDEDPPTLTHYPVWARPIQAVFDFMGYKAGYREYDAGHIIIVFFTVFSALLINDGGYGLLMMAGLVLAYRPLTRAAGRNVVHLGLYVAAATALFGTATGAFFGLQFDSLGSLHFLEFDTQDMIKISFALGITHLTMGRGMKALREFPNTRALGELGWLAIIWGVYLAIVNVFTARPVPELTLPLIIGGAAAVILFSFNEKRHFFRNRLLGCGLLVGNATTVFSDVMSYIRLMAVGFASMSLAMTTNTIAEQVGSPVFGVPILIIGHTINLGLGLIALFVHGLRLNTLEFSRQLGVQWTGRAFAPLTRIQLKAESR